MSGAQFIDCEHDTIYCDTFNCSNGSRYYIGHPDVPYLGIKVCAECAKNIIKTIPAELYDSLPKTEVEVNIDPVDEAPVQGPSPEPKPPAKKKK